MTFQLSQEVINGAKIIASLQDHPMIPSTAEICSELDYVCEYISDTHRFYGVPFTKPDKGEYTEFNAIKDAKAHFAEFYFGCDQMLVFGFRTVSLHRLVVEPLLDSMTTLSHDEILDSIENITEQLKEIINIAHAKPVYNATSAYRAFREFVHARTKERKVKEMTQGILALRM